ncbi:Uncharacterised protein [Slackia heliotrinireducens]|uniref:Uncharacterized protein n=1 Tax=Slackia heliotrinireducens (strain ATCC 29202 / DSM 20476 / NCTC 11029 / RHS 1) TaxID=471855 RepID=C7N3C2_SLAHD|nr:hypothetical protein [Slackia heliotrinireducens]ACV23645.1 hypothetical protein Shel_26430 [Slackia heliotrinireducens DSM 20476]VEH03158.1 Uncharacterised protein [Slackia heliotrinireducens]
MWSIELKPKAQEAIRERLGKHERNWDGTERDPVTVLMCATEGIRLRLLLCREGINSPEPDAPYAVGDAIADCMAELDGVHAVLDEFLVKPTGRQAQHNDSENGPMDTE